MRLPILLTAVLAFATTATAQSSINHTRLHPAGALVYATLSGAPCVKYSRELALSQIIRDPEVQEFLTPLRTFLSESMSMGTAEFEAMTGLKAQDVIPMLSNARISASFTGMDEQGMPLMHLIAEMGGQPEQMKAVASLLIGLATEQAQMEVAEMKVAGMGGWTLTPPMGGPTMHLVVHNNWAVLSTSMSDLTGIAERLGGKAGTDTLETQPIYQKLAAKCNVEKSLFSLQADLTSIWGMARMIGGDEADKVINALNLDCIEAASFSLEVDGAGIREHVYVHVPSPKGLIQAIAKAQAETIRSDSILPADTAFYASFQMPLAELLPAVVNMVQAGEPREARQMNPAFDQMKEATGLDLQQDILAHLGTEWALFAGLPSQALIPDVGLMVAVKDQQKIQVAIERLLKTFAPELEVRTLDFRGTPVYSVDITPMVGEHVDVAGPRNPSWTFVNGFLVASIWPQATKNLIAGLKANQPRLKDQADYKSLQARLVGGSPKSGNMGREYLDIKRAVGFVMDNGSPFAQMLLPSTPFGPGYPIDWALLPMTETVTSRLFGLGSRSTWDQDGFSAQSYSPTGRVTGLFLVAGLAGALVSVRGAPGLMVDDFGGDWEAQMIARTHMDVQALALGVEAFKRAEGRLPTDEEWPLSLLSGTEKHPKPFVESSIYDPWGYQYILKRKADAGFVVISYGEDGAPGGQGPAADISSEPTAIAPVPEPGK